MSARSFCWTLVLLMIPVSVSAQGAPTSGEPVRPPTWSGDVAKIIYDNCTSCHRPGESAPFPLTSYAETKKRALMIQHVTEDRLMPPWHPAKGHGEFLDEMRLSDAEIATLRRWVEAEMPEGDPKSAPKAPTYPAGWQLGEPDMVVTMSEEFQVPAGGPDIYRNFVIPLNLKEDKWVKAVEVRPAARTVVHHVLFFLDDTGSARELDKQDKTPGFRSMGFRRTGSLGGSAVGARPAAKAACSPPSRTATALRCHRAERDIGGAAPLRACAATCVGSSATKKSATIDRDPTHFKSRCTSDSVLTVADAAAAREQVGDGGLVGEIDRLGAESAERPATALEELQRIDVKLRKCRNPLYDPARKKKREGGKNPPPARGEGAPPAAAAGPSDAPGAQPTEGVAGAAPRAEADGAGGGGTEEGAEGRRGSLKRAGPGSPEEGGEGAKRRKSGPGGGDGMGG